MKIVIVQTDRAADLGFSAGEPGGARLEVPSLTVPSLAVPGLRT